MKVALIYLNKRRGADTIALRVDFEYLKNEPVMRNGSFF